MEPTKLPRYEYFGAHRISWNLPNYHTVLEQHHPNVPTFLSVRLSTTHNSLAQQRNIPIFLALRASTRAISTNTCIYKHKHNRKLEQKTQPQTQAMVNERRTRKSQKRQPRSLKAAKNKSQLRFSPQSPARPRFLPDPSVRASGRPRSCGHSSCTGDVFYTVCALYAHICICIYMGCIYTHLYTQKQTIRNT